MTFKSNVLKTLWNIFTWLLAFYYTTGIYMFIKLLIASNIWKRNGANYRDYRSIKNREATFLAIIIEDSKM